MKFPIIKATVLKVRLVNGIYREIGGNQGQF